MKTLKLSLLLLVFLFVNCQSEKNSDFVVLEAIKGILKEHFARHEPKDEFYFYGPDGKWLAGKVLLAKPAEISVRVILLDPHATYQIKFPSIVLFDSGEHFLEGGQNRLPGRNFARYLLMLFIM